MKLFLCFFLLIFSFQIFADEKFDDVVTDSPKAFSFEMKKPSGEADFPGIGKLVFSLLLVVVVTFFLVAGLKKIGYGEKKLFTDSSTINIIASKKLSVKSTVHLISVDNVDYVVVEKENAISIIEHINNDQSDTLS